ncbi:unnamed protein product [Prunus armeniaca]
MVLVILTIRWQFVCDDDFIAKSVSFYVWASAPINLMANKQTKQETHRNLLSDMLRPGSLKSSSPPNPPSKKGYGNPRSRTPYKPPMDLSITEVGESFNSENTKSQQPFVCEICVEPKAAASEWFGIKNCSHAYCRDCMVSYVASKLEVNITSIRCPDPDCTSGLLDPEHCRSILPREVFERWGVALCEAVVPASQKFYCPYKDCSAMLIIDDDGKKGMIVRQSDCPHCRKLFCAQCKVPWHVGFECAKFQKLNKVERERENMLRNLAKKEQWRRCPNCRFYVERSWGCNIIQCSDVKCRS